jgi:predicted membrane-bound spermidine synthase
MRRALCAVFFLSGAAALLFENLWFRQAGLAFGNGVWASSLVLSSFMAGLALGGGLAARWEGRILRPLRAYARLEAVVGVGGLALVLALPRLGMALAPLLEPFLDRPLAVNALRLGAAFLLLVVPTAAMGLTLPILTRALGSRGYAFGESLGALYGWNTIGAVAGALAVETALVPRLGVRATALVASALNLASALLALVLARRAGEGESAPGPPAPAPSPLPRLARDAPRLLAVAFATGGVLLALEVVWFRFLAMFSERSALAFALLLAVVLLGIGLGGLLAGRWVERRVAVPFLGALVATSGFLVVALYAGFGRLLPFLLDERISGPLRTLAAAAYLTLPVSFLSGLVFTLLGAAVDAGLRCEHRSAGALTLANTTGALVGALLGGFLLLPVLGMERAFALLAFAYALCAVLLPPRARLPASGAGRTLAVAAFAFCGGFWILFPYGLMERLYVKAPLARFGARIHAVREGLTETAVLLEHRLRSRHHSFRLATGGFSMSTTTWNARRYMGLYAYLPLALHERPRSALLICYGLGVTARALARSSELETIDVVDISPEVLELAALQSPFDENPLADPRVRAHVEDGRAFLALTPLRFDIITAEPPPPTNAGVASLYSREFFALLRSRLAEGGFVTYWLPVHTLGDAPARAVIAAFCGVFADCSLWSGHELDWMLVGTRNARGPAPAEHVRRQWEDDRIGAELGEVGLEGPEHMGALFLQDAEGLRRLAGDAPSLVDDQPGRIGRLVRLIPTPFAYRVLFTESPPRIFAGSPQVARLWPAALVPRTLGSFRQEEIQNRLFVARLAGREAEESWLHELYTDGAARLPMLSWFGSDPDLLRVAREAAGAGERDPWVSYQLAVAALADRRPAAAAELAKDALPLGDDRTRFLLAYALALDGRLGEARGLLPRLAPRAEAFLARTFGPSAARQR